VLVCLCEFGGKEKVAFYHTSDHSAMAWLCDDDKNSSYRRVGIKAEGAATLFISSQFEAQTNNRQK
jgi:UDP-N-acetylmuramyl tripeptide synthase